MILLVLKRHSSRCSLRQGLCGVLVLCGAMGGVSTNVLAQTPSSNALSVLDEPGDAATETQPLPPVDWVEITEADYILGPGDHLSILVIGYPEFDGTRVVLPDGTISLPLIGSLRVADETADAVSRRLTNMLGRYLTNPVVNVSLAILRPVVVNVAGDVYRPGPVQLTSLTSTEQRITTNATISSSTNSPTLGQALVAAGGVRRSADLQQVTVSRLMPNGSVATFTVNLWEALTADRVAVNLILRDGDTVYVPQSVDNDPASQRLLASSTFAPTQVRVRVVGEVNRPGEINIPPNSSVSSAVAVAGGPTDDARLGQVSLIRRDDSTGEINEQIIDLSNLIDDFQIQDGDVVWVPKQPYLNALDTLGRLTDALIAPLNIIDFLQGIGVLDQPD